MSEGMKLQDGAQANPAPTDGGEKTFNQDEVNRIVSERLTREKEKAGAELEAREKALVKREFEMKARETLSEKNLPAELLEALNCTDEEAFNKSIEIIEKHIKEAKPLRLKGMVPANPDTSSGSGWGNDSIRSSMGL